MTRLSVAITTHPLRPLAGRLRRQLDVDVDQVVVDPEPAGMPWAWRTARIAWDDTPLDATHRLVLQDDALPCQDAISGVLAAIESAPDLPIAFYAGEWPIALGNAVRAAHAAGRPFVDLPPGTGFVPTVALCLPARDAWHLVKHADAVAHHGQADDSIVESWRNLYRRGVLVAVPSLFDHDTHAPSVCNPGKRFVRQAVVVAAHADDFVDRL